MTVICTSNKPTGQRNRESLGQFFTPPHVADLMASWVDPLPERITLLDAGAGTGALIAALVRRICRAPGVTRHLQVTAFEIDPSLAQSLAVCMASCRRMCESSGISFSADIRQADFIATAAPIARGDLFAESLPPFNVALVNPPYRKIRSDSAERLHLRSAGIETSNLYAGFLALIIRLLAPGGQLVSITPRSFCNGPYFRPFREDLLNRMTIRRIHVFDSRSAVFEQDDVLQETIWMRSNLLNHVRPFVFRAALGRLRAQCASVICRKTQSFVQPALIDSSTSPPTIPPSWPGNGWDVCRRRCTILDWLCQRGELLTSEHVRFCVMNQRTELSP
jgi:tRNA1(Val) A37 N6-methylase TrmN6